MDSALPCPNQPERASRSATVFGEPSGGAAPAETTQWAAVCCLRGHCADVGALAWAPRAESLFSGDVSGTTIVWNLGAAKPQQIVREHEHYVQGVAWDPVDEHLVSVSCDRTVRFYSSKAKDAGTLGGLVKPKERDFSCHTVLAKRTQSIVNALGRDKPATASGGDEKGGGDDEAETGAPEAAGGPEVGAPPPHEHFSC